MKKWLKIILISVAVCFVVATACVAVYINNVISQEQVTLNMQKLGNFTNKINIYDAKGNVVSTNNQLGTPTIELSQLNDYTKNAFVAIEDNDFYNHNGLNYKRMLKALFTNITSGYAKEGASTITQQLIKNTHLTNEKTIERKIKEAVLSLDLEQKYTKDEILETYLNVIYFGNNSYGIEQASQNYFGHSASTLSLSESAVLAGLIKSPLLYSPLENPENCKTRRNLVLKQMLNYGYVDEEQYKNALKQQIVTTQPKEDINSTFDYFVVQEVKQKLNLSEKSIYSSGLNIYTTIDNNIQNNVYNSLYKNLGENKDCSAMVLDCQTGAVLGCFSTLQNPDIARSPASLIKPLLCYGSAFENNLLTPSSPILDEPIHFDSYAPQNVDHKCVGWTDARYCLSHSLNIPAVKVLEYVGIDKAKAFASKFGLNFGNEDNHLALALGSMQYGTALKQIASAYTALANMGEQKDVHFVTKICDRKGNILFEHKSASKRVCKDSTAFMLNDVLKNSATTGTAKKLANLNIPLASKTGTNGAKDGTNLDAWNVAYNSKFCTCVWYGNVSGNSEFNLSKNQNGGTIATKSAVNLWSKLKQNNKFEDFLMPTSVQKIKIDKHTLDTKHKIELASNTTPERYITYDIYPTANISKLKTSTFEPNVQQKLGLLSQLVEPNIIEIKWNSTKGTNYAISVKTAEKTYVSKIVKSGGETTSLKLENLPFNTKISIQVKPINPTFDDGESVFMYIPATEEKQEHEKLSKQLSNLWLNKK